MKIKTRFYICDNEKQVEELNLDNAIVVMLMKLNFKYLVIEDLDNQELYKKITRSEYTKTNKSFWYAVKKAVKLGRSSGFFYTYIQE